MISRVIRVLADWARHQPVMAVSLATLLVASAGARELDTQVSAGGLLPAQLEKELTTVQESFQKVQAEPELGADLAKALDHWFARIKEAQEKLAADKSPEARIAYLGVLETAVGDLQTRMTALNVPAHRLISRYQDVYRQLRSVQANLAAANKGLTDQLSGGDESLEQLEAKARDAVASYLRSGKTDARSKRDLLRLKVQIKSLPFRKELLKTSATQLKTLEAAVAKLSGSARAMEENLDAALVGFQELAAVYGDLKNNIQLSRVVASSASQLLGADYQRLLTGLTELADKQTSFLEALKSGASMGTDLLQLQDAVTEQQRVGNQLLERAGGAGNIDDLIEKYGPKSAVKAE